MDKVGWFRWGFLPLLLLLLLPKTTAWDVVARWDFNGPDPAPATVGRGRWQLLGDVTASVGSGAGSSDPLPDGNLALTLTHFPNATNRTQRAGIEFVVVTDGLPVDRLQLDLRGSATACRHVRVESSMDGGVSYHEAAPLELTRAGVFEKGLTLALARDPDRPPGTELRLRLTAAPGASGAFEGVSADYGPGGTWRLDRVTALTETTSPDPVGPLPPPVLLFTNQIFPQVHLGGPATNVFLEQVLRPGETLRLDVTVQDTNHRPVFLRPEALAAGSPGTWRIGAQGGTSAGASLEVTPSELHAGQAFRFALGIDNGMARTTSWTVYIPTRPERQVVLEEFLANPANGGAEYVELVNLGPGVVGMEGWMIGDGVSVRHRFGATNRLEPGRAVVVWGDAPNLPAPDGAEFVVASTGGLSLNNAGDQLVVRNARSNLLDRIVFRGTDLSRDGSLARDRLPDGPFRPHPGDGPTRGSPGLPTVGVPWVPASGSGSVRAWIGPRVPPGLELRWEPTPGRRARILASPDMDAAFQEVVRDLEEGVFRIPDAEVQSFYRVEWQ